MTTTNFSNKSGGGLVNLSAGIVIFVSLLHTGFSYAQKLRFDHLSVKQGLSQGNVWDIYQDRPGFIWVATEDGLNLFDGYKFTIFRTDPADSFSISANNVDCFAEDKDGRLWIGTQNGLNLYDRRENRFHRFYHDATDPFSLSSSDIGHVYVDSQNRIWVATIRGLNLYNAETNRWTRFLHDPDNPSSLPDHDIECVIEDSMNKIWVGSGGGLSLLNEDGRTFTNFFHDPSNPHSLSSNKVRALFEDSERVLWIGTFDGGLNKMHPVQKTFTHFKYDPSDPGTIGNNYVYNMAESNSGDFWIATDGALNRMDKKKGTFTRMNAIQGDETGLSSDIVSKVMFDKDDRMWVGTRFGGLNIYDPDKYGFHHFRYNSYEKSCLSNNNVTDFEEDANGNFWVATDGGSLNYYDRKSGTFSNFMNVFANNKVLAVARDKDGNIWTGMWAGGLNHYDTRTKKVKRYMHDPSNSRSLSDNNVFDILVARDGSVWIATWGRGLNKYDPGTDDFTQFVNDPSNPRTISGSPLSILMEDTSGRIWIGTEQEGFDILDPKTEVFTHHQAGTAQTMLSGNSVFCFLEDSRQRYWIGTNGSGLNLFDPETNVFKTYRQKDGLPNEGIMGLLEDASGFIWISTNKGVSRFDPEKETFKNFTESDGLQSDQFNRWAFKKLSTGELLFGGTNGFNFFDPSAIKDNASPPPVYITDFRLFNKPVPVGEQGILTDHILLTKSLTLRHHQNIFSFEFTALNYRQPEKNMYRYKLEGFDDDWIDAGTERKKEYTNIGPGQYTFRVIASNNDGVWNTEGAALAITIVPPFWKTWWFNSTAGLSIIIGLYGFVRYQKKKAIRQQLELQSIIEERTKELKQQNEEIRRKAENERVHNWITEGLALVGETISRNNHQLETLGRETLKTIIKYVSASQGIIAISTRESATDEHLSVLATYGLKHDHNNGRIGIGEGLLGETYRDKEKKILMDLPADYFKIESGLGQALPSGIVLHPLKTEDGEMVGVMEIGFLGSMNDTAQLFLDKVSSVLALNIFAASLNQKTTMLLQQAKEQTEELRAQEEEMRQNMEELEATSEEFRRRELEYQRKIQQLELKLAEKQP
jgi:ligand-binding sensor domain-containing protein